MFFQRSNSYRPPIGRAGIGWRRRFSAALPWIVALGIVAGSMLPIRQWVHFQLPRWNDSRSQEFETIWRHAGNLNQHHPVDVIRTIDGDTFEARVHLAPGQDVMTRVRLRGIDAPELKAACAEELRMAEAATSALRDLLRQGEIAIYNIGPDKYQGRVVADVATKRTGNVSAALIGAGHVRSYNGGHRNGWCASATR
jgi:endonuclease YncB( thermonuclease family)